ncbi:MAG: DivIVA domain-containing protein [Oligoflexia bacterium]|nr:DivIVA domain-containing protein [Oligoflexia bacterium]
MKIAPIDIAHKTFGRRLGGLDAEEVASFLKEVASEMEGVIRERNQLKEMLRERELQVLEFKEKDKALKETLMTAHKMTENLRKDAEREAALVLNDAQQKADAIIRDSRDSLKKTYQEITELKRQKTQFEVALKNLLTAHLELIERNNGYLPHIATPTEAVQGGSTPNLRQGKPVLET